MYYYLLIRINKLHIWIHIYLIFLVTVVWYTLYYLRFGHAILLHEKYSFISNVCETGFNEQFSLK
jgi:hypothetical protein